MTFRGRVQNGVIVLDTPARLPEGALVEVATVSESANVPVAGLLTLAERYGSIVGIVEGLPPDFAENHDHYIHGSARPTDP